MPDPQLLLLADGRFPCGGYAHSAGLEAAVGDRRVQDITGLEQFLLGWLNCGLEAEAALAAAAADAQAAAGSAALASLDELAEAAVASPALRKTGRRLGRTLLRTAAKVWPQDRRLAGYLSAVLAGKAAGQHPIAMGAAVAAAQPAIPAANRAAAGLYAYSCISGAAWAAVRLLPVDPALIAEMLARLSPAIQRAAGAALTAGRLPAGFSPAHDIGAEDHARWEVRLFAS